MPKSKLSLMKKKDIEETYGGSDEEEETEEETETENESEEETDSESENESEEDEDVDEDETDEETDEETENENDEETETVDETESETVDDEEVKEGTVNMTNKLNWHVVDKEDRITDNFLGVYEYVRALSIRSKQIMLGAKVLLKDAEELRKKYTPKEIAKLEIKNKCCPLIIVREVPNGNIEKWDINELDILFSIN